MSTELSARKRGRLLLWAVVAATFACVAAGVVFWRRPAPLTPTELRCVGSWAYLSPDHAGKTCIVYHFADDRSVREEHYYLTSAWPDVPRITMRGKWSIDASGRIVVEPNDGPAYVRDSISGWLDEYFDDGRQGWPRPALTRFFDVKSATHEGIQVETNLSGGRGRATLTMTPYQGDPASDAIR